MINMNQSLRALAILADADHETFLAGAAAARCAAEGIEITSGPCDGSDDIDRMAISQQAMAAVMCAPEPRYGQRCYSRGTHTVRKLYHIAATGPTTHTHRCRHVLPRLQHCWGRTQ